MTGAHGPDAPDAAALVGPGTSGASGRGGGARALGRPGRVTTIDGYLDRLLVELRGTAHDIRRILAEVEAHLDDAADEAVARGMSRADAERHAVARFGTPRTVARRFAAVPAPGRDAAAAAVTELVGALVRLAAVGLVAIGVSGLVAMGMRATLGASFVAGDLEGVTYTADRCADFAEYHPEASSCAAAATLHHADEVEEYRIAAGLLGLLVASAAWLWNRRHGHQALPPTTPAAAEPAGPPPLPAASTRGIGPPAAPGPVASSAVAAAPAAAGVPAPHAGGRSDADVAADPVGSSAVSAPYAEAGGSSGAAAAQGGGVGSRGDADVVAGDVGSPGVPAAPAGAAGSSGVAAAQGGGVGSRGDADVVAGAAGVPAVAGGSVGASGDAYVAAGAAGVPAVAGGSVGSPGVRAGAAGSVAAAGDAARGEGGWAGDGDGVDVRVAVLPEAFMATAGAALFGVAGVLLLGQSIGLLAGGGSGHGVGQWLSGALVSLAVAAGFGWSLLTTLRSRAAALV